MCRASLAILLTALVSGCIANPKPMSVEDMGGQQRWAASDMVDVAISVADRNRADEHFGLFGKYPGTISTGSVWTRIFVGDPLKSPVFTIISAKLQDETLAAGFAIRFHYVVDGSLSFNGRDYPIHADGARASGGPTMGAMHEAVQLGVVDAAHKVRFIICGGLKP